jgi:hypothetical protein
MWKKGQQLWQHLDELAARDPEVAILPYPSYTESTHPLTLIQKLFKTIKAYKKFISNMKTNAESAAKQDRLAKPGFAIRCPSYTPSTTEQRHVLFINVALSSKIGPPPDDDPLNIPICMSEIRTGPGPSDSSSKGIA